jgi:hypothetical protein
MQKAANIKGDDQEKFEVVQQSGNELADLLKKWKRLLQEYKDNKNSIDAEVNKYKNITFEYTRLLRAAPPVLPFFVFDQGLHKAFVTENQKLKKKINDNTWFFQKWF